MVSKSYYSEVYSQLHSIAASYLVNERSDHSLSPTALVNEAYLKLEKASEEVAEKSQFFFAAGRAMRRILVDSARRRNALKRGNGRPGLAWNDGMVADFCDHELVLHVDEALEKMRNQWPDLVDLVEMRFFAGLTMQEVSEALCMPLRTAERNWQFAKAWLRAEFEK